MENLSLKQWAIAGMQSGIRTAIIMIFISILFHNITNIDIIFVLGISLNIFLLGLILGIILFFYCGKLSSKNRLSKCLFVSIMSVICIFSVSWIALVFMSEYFFAVLGNEILMILLPLIGIAGIFLPFFYSGAAFLGIFLLILIGAAFGFLINYFITRMERKMEEREAR